MRLTFEQWVAQCFDHPASDPAWHFHPDAVYWHGPVEYMTRLFEQCDILLAPYSDAQVDQGLWFLASPSCSNHMFTLVDQSVPWDERRCCVRSMYDLFDKCFARRCSQHLSHLEEPGASPLTSSCYMWFDLLPIYPEPEDATRQELDREFLAVMERILRIPHDACREGALHGLGHWGFKYLDDARFTIGRFLADHPGLRAELVEYALQAMTGRIQ